jgi:hypothetical protein
MDCRAFASPKGLRPRRRVKPGNDDWGQPIVTMESND